jgi:hypothetical protein
MNRITQAENIGSSPNIANAMLGAVPSVVYNEDCVKRLNLNRCQPHGNSTPKGF